MPSIMRQFGLMFFFHGILITTVGFGFFEMSLLSRACGVLSVLLVGLAGISFGRPRLGFAWALLFCVAPWNLAWSRGADAEHILAVLHFSCVWFLLARFFAHKTLFSGLLLGISLGASWYVYATNQIIPLWIVCPVLLGIMTEPPAQCWKRCFALLLGFGASSWTAVSKSIHDGFVFPVRATLPPNDNYRVLSVEKIMKRAAPAMRQLFWSSDDAWYLSSIGPLFGPTLLLAVLGIIVLLCHRKSGIAYRCGISLVLSSLLGFIPAVIVQEDCFRRLLITVCSSTLIQGYALEWIINSRKYRVATTIITGIVLWELYIFTAVLVQPESERHQADVAISKRYVELSKSGKVIFVAPDQPSADEFERFARLAAGEPHRTNDLIVWDHTHKPCPNTCPHGFKLIIPIDNLEARNRVHECGAQVRSSLNTGNPTFTIIAEEWLCP